MSKIIFSAFEKIKFADTFNNIEVIAKVDTGAFSGVVHCENIKEQDGELSFDLLGNKELNFKTRDYVTRIVKNTHGGIKKRYLTRFNIIVENRKFNILLGIDERNGMKFNMLIGRAFLIKNNIIVDSSMNIDLDNEWNKMGEKQ